MKKVLWSEKKEKDVIIDQIERYYEEDTLLVHRSLTKEKNRQFWGDFKDDYPYLAALALFLDCNCVQSCTCERRFSSYKYYMPKFSYNMKIENMFNEASIREYIDGIAIR